MPSVEKIQVAKQLEQLGVDVIEAGFPISSHDESKKPSFRSDRYQFTVVMPNLNYNVPQKKESNPLEIQILNMIKKIIKSVQKKWQWR